MKLSRTGMATIFIGLAAVATILAAGPAAAQTRECGPEECTFESSDDGDVSNDSGAVVVYEDGGSATVDNESGAVLVHADGGSAAVDNESGAVVVFADGGEASVDNETGAVLVHSDDVDRRRSSSATFFAPHFIHERDDFIVRRVTRLPVTGGGITDVVAMAFVMIAIGGILLSAARVLPRFLPARVG